MRICVYMRMYTCVHAYVHMRTCVCIHAYMRMYTCIHAYVYMRTCVYAYVYPVHSYMRTYLEASIVNAHVGVDMSYRVSFFDANILYCLSLSHLATCMFITGGPLLSCARTVRGQQHLNSICNLQGPTFSPLHQKNNHNRPHRRSGKARACTCAVATRRHHRTRLPA